MSCNTDADRSAWLRDMADDEHDAGPTLYASECSVETVYDVDLEDESHPLRRSA